MATTDVIFQWIDTILFIIKWFWWAFIALFVIVLKIMHRNWIIEAIIFEKRGSNMVKTNDRIGKYKDPFTGIIGYKFQKSGDTTPVLNYDWILHNNFKPTNIMEWLMNKLRGTAGTAVFYRYGSKQYKPINIKRKDASKIKRINRVIKDKDGKDIIIPIYQQVDPRDKLRLLDFEVVDWDNMNFMAQEQRASIERRKKQGDWIKQIAIPLAMLAVTMILCIILIKYAYDYSLAMRSSAPPKQTNAEQPNIPIVGDVIPPPGS